MWAVAESGMDSFCTQQPDNDGYTRRWIVVTDGEMRKGYKQ